MVHLLWPIRTYDGRLSTWRISACEAPDHARGQAPLLYHRISTSLLPISSSDPEAYRRTSARMLGRRETSPGSTPTIKILPTTTTPSAQSIHKKGRMACIICLHQPERPWRGLRWPGPHPDGRMRGDPTCFSAPWPGSGGIGAPIVVGSPRRPRASPRWKYIPMPRPNGPTPASTRASSPITTPPSFASLSTGR